jgi:ankyrin repeat protein
LYYWWFFARLVVAALAQSLCQISIRSAAGPVEALRNYQLWAGQEAALADDEAEIVRLLKALNGSDPAEASGGDHDAANWVSRALRWAADMGLSPDISTLILSETLNEIRAASSPAPKVKGPKRGRTRRSRPKASDLRPGRHKKGKSC